MIVSGSLGNSVSDTVFGSVSDSMNKNYLLILVLLSYISFKIAK